MKDRKSLKTRWWVSWIQSTEDYRPLTDPPVPGVLGWWCSGYWTNGNAIICAMVEGESEDEAKAAIAASWPEAIGGWRFFENRGPGFVPGSRFPLRDWNRERMGLGGF